MRPDKIEVIPLAKPRRYLWRRVTPDGRVLAESPEAFMELFDCFDDILRVNGRPFELDWANVAPDMREKLEQQ